jgi:hypothetical protein
MLLNDEQPRNEFASIRVSIGMKCKENEDTDGSGPKESAKEPDFIDKPQESTSKGK